MTKKIFVMIEMSEESCLLLAQQKLELLNAVDEGVLSQKIDGIIYMIDHIQDTMVDEKHFPKKVVFPFMESDDEEEADGENTK